MASCWAWIPWDFLSKHLPKINHNSGGFLVAMMWVFFVAGMLLESCIYAKMNHNSSFLTALGMAFAAIVARTARRAPTNLQWSEPRYAIMGTLLFSHTCLAASSKRNLHASKSPQQAATGQEHAKWYEDNIMWGVLSWLYNTQNVGTTADTHRCDHGAWITLNHQIDRPTH